MSTIPSLVSKLGLWWPDADPDLLRQAADVWETFAHTLEQVRVTTEKAGQALVGDNDGHAIDTCQQSLAVFTGDLASTVAVAVEQAGTLRDYAHRVEHAQHTLIEIASVAATVTAAFTVGAFFTLGATEAGAGIAAGAAIVAAEAVGVALTDTAATIIAGLVEAVIIDLAIQEARIQIFHEGGFSWTELGISAGLGPLGSALGARVAARAVASRSAVAIGAVAEHSPGVVKVFRVGSDNARVLIDSNGDVVITGKKTLFLNFGDEARAEAFLATRLEQGRDTYVMKTFQVPRSYVEHLRLNAVPESLANRFPDRPFVVDATKAADQFGLRPAHFRELMDNIIPGSGAAP
jgi:hypothetical protein